MTDPPIYTFSCGCTWASVCADCEDDAENDMRVQVYGDPDDFDPDR